MIAWCCGAVIGALYVVGIVSHTSLRHAVQTLPLWLPIAAGALETRIARWLALPLFLFWLGIVVVIWLFLLGWAQFVRGHFTPVEIAMTIVMAVACTAGIRRCVRMKGSTRWPLAMALFVVSAALQYAAFRVSFLPGIARR